MTRFLLDVNVLVALTWPGHVFHRRARAWFAAEGARGWASCALTQTALVRILSNRAFSPQALAISDALRVLGAATEHAEHQFWPDSLSVRDAVSEMSDRLVGHQQLIDAYLLGLALKRKGKLATFDLGILALAPSGSRQHSGLELLV